MRTSGRVRAGGVLRRLLFVVLLALGVLMMHSMGHPDGGPGAAVHASAHVSGGMHQATGGEVRAERPAMTSHDTQSAPMAGMDMASLCVAVLGTWVLTAVLRAAFVRRRGPALPRSAPVAAVPRPVPPSPRPDLTTLSVLRI
ncbi:DUF6153 family protein [Streptomyces botrytidirepellens]|uniref:DUF6153 family protein n=1 Tax=Streptomyces botrytidirepellens TaxID=2486417 RepID=UPI00161FDEC2|nr:DUF6153 family protein [Streptomyces botrytidirepellens]